MPSCPNCKVQSLEREQLLLSSRLVPLACPNCKALLGIEGLFAGTYTAALEFLVLGIGALLLQAKPLSRVFMLLFVWCGFNLVAGLFLSPVAFTHSQVMVARWTLTILGLVFLVVFALSIFHA